MYQQYSFEVFQRYFKKDTKAWFSPVKPIYSHSLLHNIILNRTDVNAHFFIALENNLPNFCVIISENKKIMFRF